MAPLLSCRSLVCRLGHQDVLRGASLELEEGQSVAVVGTSGCGKSTLLRIVAGLEVPLRGEVALDGRVASKNGQILVPPHRRRVAMLFQDAALWPNLSVADNVSLGLAGQRLGRKEVRRRTSSLLQRCGLADLAMRAPQTLSGGQQQRAALARALAAQPRLLLLDEPFGGLDLLTKQAVVEEVLKLRSQVRFGLVLVTHDPLEIESLCDSLAVLEDGRVAEYGSLSQIAAHPRTRMAQSISQRVLHRALPNDGR